jgi:hypothetical protein
MSVGITKIGTLVDEKGNLITLTKEQVEVIKSEFVVFKDGSSDRAVSRVTFFETEQKSGKFDYFGFTSQESFKDLEKTYDQLQRNESIYFRTLNIDGYLDSNTKINDAEFSDIKKSNLKITLKSSKPSGSLTPTQKVEIIRANAKQRNQIARQVIQQRFGNSTVAEK